MCTAQTSKFGLNKNTVTNEEVNMNSMHQNMFYFGDLCYVLGRDNWQQESVDSIDSIENSWHEFCDVLSQNEREFQNEEHPVIIVTYNRVYNGLSKDITIFAANTQHGDGCYGVTIDADLPTIKIRNNAGHLRCPVDSGLIGLACVADIAHTEEDRNRLVNYILEKNLGILFSVDFPAPADAESDDYKLSYSMSDGETLIIDDCPYCEAECADGDLRADCDMCHNTGISETYEPVFQHQLLLDGQLFLTVES